MGVVFISYAHEDKELAIWLTECLEAKRECDVWRDKPDAKRGGVQSTIGEVIDGCACGVFLISRNWLNSSWGKWEAERLHDRDPELCIPVYLEPHETLKKDIPPSLAGVFGVDFSGERYAALWELRCKIRNESAGPEKFWKQKGEALAATAEPAPITEMPPGTRFCDAEVLECDRHHEFSLVEKGYIEKDHHLFLIAGPKWEAHHFFVSKIEESLKGYELLRPTWRGGERFFPASKDVYRERLARALGCARDADLPGKLRRLLERQNVLLTHPVIDCNYKDKPIVDCFSEWLPELLNEASPVHRIKCLQPVAWDVPKTWRWFRRVETSESETQAEGLLKAIVGAAKLPHALIRLRPITEEHVDQFCEFFDISASECARLKVTLEEAKAKTSEEILGVIEQFMEKRRQKRVS